MKNSKQTIFMIIAVILVYAIIWYFFLRKEKAQVSTESSFRGGGFHGGGIGRRGGFFNGGRGSWGGWGYPYGGYGYQYPYYDNEPIVVVGSTKCPKGWIWMGAMLGCQKPQGV